MLDDEPPVATPYVADCWLKKVAALALWKTSVPPPYCANAKLDAVPTVAVPAVIVQVPAPKFCIQIVSPALNMPVLTVMVVAPAAVICTRWPTSPTTSV